VLTSAPVSSRNHLADLLNERGLAGDAVEVGTHRGEFAKAFLDRWEGRTLFCVDPWGVPPGYDREADLLACRKLLGPHAGRVRLVRHLSAEAAPLFADGSLDFVYIDGDHERPSVDQDLSLWWPKLKAGGILAGHDFICPGEPGGLWGAHIQPAVMEFAAREGVDVQLIPEPGQPWSWVLEKP
jgi:hypothetical protein